MQLTDVENIIATRELTLEDGKKVTVVIGQPRKFDEGDDYYCPFQISGIDNGRISYAGGIDAIQAFELALKKIGTILYTSEEAKSGKLTWDAGVDGYLGFPLPDSIRDLGASK